jgi:GDP-D-mannose dehydratase
LGDIGELINAEALLGWYPEHSFDEMVREMIECKTVKNN